MNLRGSRASMSVRCPREFYQSSGLSSTLFFDDGEREIDFVLAYKVNQHHHNESDNEEKRQIYEENLINQGLEIERAYKPDEGVHFVKIHVPLEVMRRYAEILKLRLPMIEISSMPMPKHSRHWFFSKNRGLFSFFMRYIYVDQTHFPKVLPRFTAVYSREKEYLFDMTQECFFSQPVRSTIIKFILDRQRFSGKPKNMLAFGIGQLLANNVYTAAYPLHDGELHEKGTLREALYKNWASVCKWYRYQPFDYIREYFGAEITLYFAWLGYYTYMLLLASVVGLVVFIFSLASLYHYVPIQEVCDDPQAENITMCPLCDYCKFTSLKDNCESAKIAYITDNPGTVFFAIFMSIWAALFMELWKRYSAEVTHHWVITGSDVYEEHPRPEYLARLQHVPRTRAHYVTKMKEPTVPFWQMRLPGTVLSYSVVILLLALALVAMLAIVVYRMSMMFVLGDTAMTISYVTFWTSFSASLIDLCLLYLLTLVYNHLAEYLTELEMWRTQTQFENSLTLKIYLLQFVNYYSSLFYVAFVQGHFVGHPGHYNRVFGFRQEECQPGGCLLDLTIQLAIIMVGKQAIYMSAEVITPIVSHRIKKAKMKLAHGFKRKRPHPDDTPEERWLSDFKLLDWGPRSLYPEYLEMVLQYGFVTIFVAAFPLAPIFALLNNVLEMRFDARKLLTHYRRPIPRIVSNIGIWYRILDFVGMFSVITNGLIIAFTSDLIPRLVYRINSSDGSLHGYQLFKLSEFRLSDGNDLSKLAGNDGNITSCKYADFRYPPTAENPYHFNATFYMILACRFGFVVLFENLVALGIILLRWWIPDMSVELKHKMRREAYITNEIIIEHESKRAFLERDRSEA